MTLTRSPPPDRFPSFTVRVGMIGTREVRSLKVDEYRDELLRKSPEELAELCIANARLLETLFLAQEAYKSRLEWTEKQLALQMAELTKEQARSQRARDRAAGVVRDEYGQRVKKPRKKKRKVKR